MRRWTMFLVMLVGSTAWANGVEWERKECAICGKTVWAKVEYEDFGWVDFSTETPPRTEVMWLAYLAKQGVCPYCEQKYVEAFTVAMRTAMHAFIAEAKEKESTRRTIVSQQNTQEEILRVEQYLKEVAEKLKDLQLQLALLKSCQDTNLKSK